MITFCYTAGGHFPTYLSSKRGDLMPAYVLVGAQWGDEGKGKIVDYLAAQTDLVVRYAGGNNAGHTVINQMGTFSLHLVPSGIFHPETTCIIGNGVVLDPAVFLAEISDLRSRGVDVSRVFISDRAHVIMPYHILLDQLEESAKGGLAIGTTGKGVGPAYMDKTARVGIRAGELLDPISLKPRLQQVIQYKNSILTKIYNSEPFDLESVFTQCVEWGKQLKEFLRPTELLLQQAITHGKSILIEGAQGTLLDLDHGTYPYVTSSSSSVAGISGGLGIPPRDVSAVIGVFKAYCTRVGSGPIPTEMPTDIGVDIRERAWEYGTTTGRARRIGWFDAVVGRYSSRINGFTSAVLTRLDVLDGMPTVRICVGYKINGEIVEHFPSTTTLFEQCEPIYEDMDGWNEPTVGVTQLSQLPKEAMRYVKRLEELIECPIRLISTGPNREETIHIEPLF